MRSTIRSIAMASLLAVPALAIAGACGGGSKAASSGAACSVKSACCGSCGGGAQKACSAKPDAAKHAHPAEINTETLATLVASGVPVTILDARTGKYDDGRRIPGAQQLAANASAAQAAEVIKSKDALVVTYCSNLKCPASRMLAAQLAKLGYKNILEYPNGIAGWAEAGNKVTQAN